MQSRHINKVVIKNKYDNYVHWFRELTLLFCGVTYICDKHHAN